MSRLPYFRLTALWARLQALLISMLVKGMTWAKVDKLIQIANEAITLTRIPDQPTSPKSPTTPNLSSSSPSTPQVGADPAQSGSDENCQLY